MTRVLPSRGVDRAVASLVHISISACDGRACTLNLRHSWVFGAAKQPDLVRKFATRVAGFRTVPDHRTAMGRALNSGMAKRSAFRVCSSGLGGCSTLRRLTAACRSSYPDFGQIQCSQNTVYCTADSFCGRVSSLNSGASFDDNPGAIRETSLQRLGFRQDGSGGHKPTPFLIRPTSSNAVSRCVPNFLVLRAVLASYRSASWVDVPQRTSWEF